MAALSTPFFRDLPSALDEWGGGGYFRWLGPVLKQGSIGMSVKDRYGFLNHLVAQGLADRTISVYTHAVERWIIHCGTEGIDPLTADAVQMRAYSELLPNTRESKRQHAVALNHYYTWLGRTDAPTGAIRIPKQTKMVWRGIEEEAAAAVIQASRGRFPEGTATLFGLLMGLRRAEIAAVDWTRFDRELTRYTVHGKGDKVVPIPVHPIVREEIGNRQTAYRYLFPGVRTSHVNPGTVALWVAEVGARAGVPHLTPHELRHTYISDVNDIHGLRKAQELARHDSPETTAGYTRVKWEDLVEAQASLSYAPLRAVVNE